ncbi:MAG TPA: TetR family transcriptional regulator C-terminal domain-containing protein [Candidatus Acidoferrales bacterium]|nr:TetR family transcriptional regulator C-terminal domain-containing protein [Candidatus Acidoferrales bacterium]
MPKIVDHDERREEVAGAVWRAIARDGIEGATIRGVAATAGCSTGVVSHYFRDKDELLVFALRLAHRRAARRMMAALAKQPPLQGLRSVLHEALPLDTERCLEWRIWVSFWGRAVGHARLLAEHHQRNEEWRRLILALLRRAQRDGSLTIPDSVEAAADALLALVDGIGIRATLEPTTLPPARQLDLVEAHMNRLSANRQRRVAIKESTVEKLKRRK